ncbi:fructose-bisphosphate aldolase class I [Candidatus Woesearchaeota archaeon]|nr:fructose-bisphosphate aldolase class I [Candidatus Woesearchaeota archaeon]
MSSEELKKTIQDMVVPGKGILAADESTGTAGKRLASINAENTEEMRRQYRNLILTANGMEEHVCGVILFEETLSQKSDSGVLFPELLSSKGIVPGIKVDKGLVDLNDNGEKFTQGLDGLGERLEGYKKLGARFTKWRSVFSVSDTLPSPELVKRNASDLAKYAKICHEHGFVPIVEPEVLIDGSHSIERSYEVTENVLQEVFAALESENVALEHCILKPSMVISGKEASNRADVETVAKETIRCLRTTVPATLPSINFLSGGQTSEESTAHLNKMHVLDSNMPWYVSFSYGRALQEHALKAWAGKQENLEAAQEAFMKRAKLNGLATLGKYSEEME